MMTDQGPSSEKMRILVIAAHPDDIEFDAAGTIAQWIDQGAEVTYCTVTDGSGGSNEPDVDRNALIATRKEEQRAAAAVLGVKDVFFLDYPDGILQPTLELRRDLTRVIRKVKPFRVVCPDPTVYWLGDGKVWDYLGHPDHRATAEAALTAVFPSAESRPIFPELLDEGLEPHRVSEVYLTTPSVPTLSNDISDYMDRKIEALLCHKSQVDSSIVPMVHGWDGARGERIGCKYAENFQVITK